MIEFVVNVYSRKKGQDGKRKLEARLLFNDRRTMDLSLGKGLLTSQAHHLDVMQWVSEASEYVLCDVIFPSVWRLDHGIPEPDCMFGSPVKHFQSTLEGRIVRS